MAPAAPRTGILRVQPASVSTSVDAIAMTMVVSVGNAAQRTAAPAGISEAKVNVDSCCGFICLGRYFGNNGQRIDFMMSGTDGHSQGASRKASPVSSMRFR